MSALRLKADITERDRHVRFVPKSDSCNATNIEMVLRRCPESTHQVNDSGYLVRYGDDESGDSMSRADDTIIAFLMFCLEIYQREQQRKRKLH